MQHGKYILTSVYILGKQKVHGNRLLSYAVYTEYTIDTVSLHWYIGRF